jgi:hypothetical protein
MNQELDQVILINFGIDPSPLGGLVGYNWEAVRMGNAALGLGSLPRTTKHVYTLHP